MQQDMIYQKPSGTWVVKLQYTDPWLVEQFGKKRETSLRTKDKSEAQILAIPHIAEHRKRLAQAEKRRNRQAETKNLGWLYALGESHLPDGTRIMATEASAWIMGADGSVRTEKNAIMLASTFDDDLGPPIPETKPSPDMMHFANAVPKQRPKDDPDQAFYDDWVKERKPTKYIEREATKAWRAFKTVNDNMLFKDAYRPEAMKMVDALKEMGLKNGSINKHLSHMRSICSLAMLNGKLQTNPFSRIALDVSEDALDREPFTDDQMKMVRDHLHTFPLEQQKLWILLACTGMRLSEPWGATSEASENGIRKIRVGSKTETSDRWLPLPSAFLERFPERIDGPMFEDNAKNLGKQLLKSVRALGINSPSLVIHSLRHRAKDRLRALDCPDKTQHWILGHEVITAADRYGKGPAMSVLKPWIDRIGY